MHIVPRTTCPLLTEHAAVLRLCIVLFMPICTYQVHEHGMKVGMKNAVELMDATSDLYDFAINEECHEHDECGVSPKYSVQ